MAEQQEPSESTTNPLSPTLPTRPPPADLDSTPSPTAVDFLKELDTLYRNNKAIRRRHTLPSDKQLHKLPRSDKSSASNFQIGPDESSPSISPSTAPKPKAEEEVVDDLDDNCSIGTTASWILENLDFRTPSSSEVDEEEERARKGEDPLFERGEPEFIFPFPEGSVELPKYLKRERESEKTKSGEAKDEKKEDDGVEEVKGEEDDDGFTTIPEDVDQVALAAFATTVLFGGMWALENGYGKALLFQ